MEDKYVRVIPFRMTLTFHQFDHTHQLCSDVLIFFHVKYVLAVSSAFEPTMRSGCRMNIYEHLLEYQEFIYNIISQILMYTSSLILNVWLLYCFSQKHRNV